LKAHNGNKSVSVDSTIGEIANRILYTKLLFPPEEQDQPITIQVINEMEDFPSHQSKSGDKTILP
jgi:hypothetical protein